MEKRAPFDLNDAIRHWRMNLQSSPALRAQDVDELESHLRESTLALQSLGLASEEAFLIASQRLGQRQELEREFGKVNSWRVWMDRALWMMAGLLLLSFMQWCANVLSGTAMNLALFMNAHWIGFLQVSTRWVVFGVAIVGFWCLITRYHEPAAGVVRSCLKHPLLPALGIVFLNYRYEFLRIWLVNLTWPASLPDMSFKVPILSAWGKWSWWAESVLWAAALIWLAKRRWQMNSCARLKPKEHSINDLELPWRNQAQALISLGLSVEEAVLIVARRQGHGQELTAEHVKADVRSVWIERGLWMVAGILLKKCLLVNLSMILQVPMLVLAYYRPINGHLLGFLTVCLQWVAVAALVAGLWRLVTRYEAGCIRAASFILQRPLLGVIGLVFLDGGWSFLLALFSQDTPAFLDFQDNRLLVGLWNSHGCQFLHNVISVVLLFWLARRRLKFQEAC